MLGFRDKQGTSSLHQQVSQEWTNSSNNHKDAPCSSARLGGAQALFLLQPGLAEETGVGRELLRTAMGMPGPPTRR